MATIDTVTFAGDYSGVTYDAQWGSFWIVSDQSRAIYLWDRVRGVRQEYPLNLPNIEGVAIDPATNRIYTVSDSENKLYVWQYQPPN